ncbi:MAG TPA: hypothetical protein ENH29_06225 [Bacteroidetes bacterium]|nr:hypothetical protein [Bacteroidota bacterium]
MKKIGVYFIDTGFIFDSRTLLVILIVSFLLTVLVTYFIAQRIGKSLAPKYKRWLYLLVSLLPLKEVVEIVTRKGIKCSDRFLWFWLLFWLFCIFMFWFSKIKQSENTG